MSDETAICLATRNGRAYLPDQLESLLAQSERAWRLYCCDDGSSDGTKVLLADYARRDDRIVIVTPAESANRGIPAVYSHLLRRALEGGAEFVFCCDQDDVWEPQKLERVLDEFRAHGSSTAAPMLIHHDLAVVDADLAPIAGSYWGIMKLIPGDERNPGRLLSRNEVTGCAAACNRALLEIALPVPKAAIMHDWWLALCAAFTGRLRFIPHPLVRYRQHAGNVIGARPFWRGLDPFQNWAHVWQRGVREFYQTSSQARALHLALNERADLPPAVLQTIDRYARLPQLSRRERLRALTETGAWRQQLALDSALALRMLTIAKSES